MVSTNPIITRVMNPNKRKMIKEELVNKMRGCLYGQAIGDALGLGTEFMSKDNVIKNYPHGLTRYDQILQDGHRKRWQQGAWTDDTDMMLCILNAFSNGRFDIKDVARNFKMWFNGDPMGIGSHTYKVLCMADYVEKPELCSELWWKLSGEQSAANGGLMRTSVVGISPEGYIEDTENICRMTHYDPRCVGSCVIVTSIIHNLIYHNTELSVEQIIELGQSYDERIREWVELGYESSEIKNLELDEIQSMGYTLRSLAAALWCYFHAPDFESGMIAVVNEGGDADTNAAIACAILGAKFGQSSIPTYYIENLHNRDVFENIIASFINKIGHCIES